MQCSTMQCIAVHMVKQDYSSLTYRVFHAKGRVSGHQEMATRRRNKGSDKRYQVVVHVARIPESGG